jgi:fructose-1,6-bisphosphatase I/sedoheptulose-1,7-bisphosphatase
VNAAPVAGFRTLDDYTHDLAVRRRDLGEPIRALLTAIGEAAVAISGQLERGALAGALGSAGRHNVQDEEQKKLDLISNDILIAHATRTGQLAAYASEELDDFGTPPAGLARGEHLLVFDPLDGSSNIDVNLTVGTIFSILRSPRPGEEPVQADFLQPGTAQLCAGFVLYGPSTMLVLTIGEGVDAFTLDRASGRFLLTHPQLRVPPDAAEFAINASNERFWELPVRRYIHECLAGTAGPLRRDTNMRWVASLVADAFRILTRGGIFLYPFDTRQPQRDGRLRLLYECNPVAFLIEQAGGAAGTGRRRVLDVVPTGLHQRIPLIFGSAGEVDRITAMHLRNDAPEAGRNAGFDGSLFNVRSLFRVP